MRKTLTRAPFTGAPFGSFGNATPPPSPLAWNGAQPTSAQIGESPVFKWKNGTGPFDVSVTTGTTEVDRVTQSTKSYTFNTTGKTAGDYTITVTGGGETITQSVKLSARGYIWLQNNTGGVVVAPIDANAYPREYNWLNKSIGRYNYPGARVRLDGKTYTGAVGETVTWKSLKTTDPTVVAFVVNNANVTGTDHPTPAASCEFAILKAGSADIIWTAQHPQDASKEITGILHITGAA